MLIWYVQCEGLAKANIVLQLARKERQLLSQLQKQEKNYNEKL